MDSKTAGRAGPSILPFLVALVPYLLLTLRFNFVTDDAYISFRYAKNLAAGLGLRYNVGVEPPVEGFTNLLWVLWAAVFEALGADPAAWLRWTSVLCGLLLIWRLSVLIQRRVTRDPYLASASLLLFATLPPVAVWSTGGLATMPFALAVFCAFERLLGDPDRPRGVQAGLFMLLASLIRADGPGFVALILSAAALTWLSRRPPGLMKASWTAFAIFAAGFALLLGWRVSYFGDFAPNTAHAKVGLSPTRLLRGFNYVVVFLLTFLSLPLLLAFAARKIGRPRGGLALQVSIPVAGTFAYAIVVGGDFMTMGRILIPALPFLAVLFAITLRDLAALGARGRALAFGLTAACVVLSLLPGFDLHVVPHSVRERFHFRWRVGTYTSEYQRWVAQERNGRLWAVLGRVLKEQTEPGESLVYGRIGAVGYFSDLFIYDRKGLVNREVAREIPADDHQSPGHDKRAPLSFFFTEDGPTYMHARLFPRSSSEQIAQARFENFFTGSEEDKALAEFYESRLIDLPPLEEYDEPQSLWLIGRIAP